MSDVLVKLDKVCLGYGGNPLFDGLDLVIKRGERLCLLGRNGAGKSSLLKLIAGLADVDDGTVTRGSHVSVTYLPQEPLQPPGMSAEDYVAAGLSAVEKDQHHRARFITEELGIDPDVRLGPLSGGEFRRLALARALVSGADLLILDEPTNHLDIETIGWLEQRMAGFEGALLLVSHDRMFLANIANACLWLDRGDLRRLNKGFSHFDDWQDETFELEQRARDKFNKKLDAELKWLHGGLTARRKRNQGRLRKLKAMREERSRFIEQNASARLKIEQGKRSGQLVIDARAISKAFAGRTIIKDFTVRMQRGDRLGIVGPNGAGKTTLVQMLTGRLEPDEGIVKLGTNLEFLEIDQRREQLGEDMTLRQVLTGAKHVDGLDVRGNPRHVVSYMKDFLFDPAQVDMPVRSLSGGERNRLLLAKAFARPANLIVLDEPTNDLDMETLDLLIDVLGTFDGSVIIISHDRAFLDALVTSTILLDGCGEAVEYAGGYSDAIRQRANDHRSRTPSKSQPSKKKGHVPERSKKVKARLGYRDAYDLEQLPDRIGALMGAIEALEAELADPNLFARAPDRFKTVCDQLEQKRDALQTAEDRWLELEEKREAMEGS